MKTWLKALGAVAVAAGGAAVLAALFVKTQGLDPEAHSRVVESIRSQQHLNAVLKQQVLSARYGLLTQYDPLTQTVHEIGASASTLAEATEQALGGEAATRADLDRVAEAAQVRAAKVERFKSENSILKNSLFYTPHAGEAALTALQKRPPTPERDAAIEAVNRLTRSTLAYAIRADADVLREQRAARDSLSRAIAQDRDTDVEILLRHAEKVDEKLPVVSQLIVEISADDVEARLTELESAYATHYANADAEANRYRVVLYCWSLVLLFAALFAGWKLQRLYQNLAQLVAERTRKLDEALSALWGEMELARKIQTALLPSKPELRDCDVAVAMQPADQVGGDYYDILTVDGREWILIGDVSGHGVPAGLVMMMCQTAVRTALHSDPGMEPDRLLALVNRSLTENIDRLGEDKYVTMTALRRDPDGVMHHAGLHQDLFVYRQATGLVEDIRSSGVWLGITAEISPMLRVKQLSLEPGDALLLYTDGITEARKDGQMLDNDGLRRLFQECATESAEGIVSHLQSTLGAYETRDDVALIVLKELGPGRVRERRATR